MATSQQQQQSKLGTMKPTKTPTKTPKKAIIDKNAPGMDAPYYSRPEVMKKLGDKPRKTVKKTPKPTKAGVMKSIRKTMGY